MFEFGLLQRISDIILDFLVFFQKIKGYETFLKIRNTNFIKTFLFLIKLCT